MRVRVSERRRWEMRVEAKVNLLGRDLLLDHDICERLD